MARIEGISAKNFKGATFSHEFGNNVVWLYGPNRAGKTSRMQAVSLVLSGYIPGYPKTNAGIIENFGTDGELFASVTVSGVVFGRKLYLDSKGKATQQYSIDGKRVSAEEFATKLVSHGNPFVFDTKRFWELSDKKKIEEIFGGSGSQQIGDITTRLQDAKEGLNEARRDYRAKQTTISDLSVTLSQIDVPPMLTLAQVSKEIGEIEAEIDEVKARMGAARAKTEAEAEAEAARVKAEAEAARVDRPVPEPTPPPGGPGHIPEAVPGPATDPSGVDPRIMAVIDTMKAAGCRTCAAMVVIRKKFGVNKEVVNGR